MKTAIILNCGRQICRPIKADKTICCDGAYLVCPVVPDVLLGDFDSLGEIPDDFEGTIIQHDSHKNASDGELAVYYAKTELASDEIVFYGILGGRPDHVLCNLAIMKLADDLGMPCSAQEDGLNIYFCGAEKTLTIPTSKGETISILPYGGNALVSCSNNLEYPLDGLLLTPADSRGLSNVSKGGAIKIDLTFGSVLVFRHLI